MLGCNLDLITASHNYEDSNMGMTSYHINRSQENEWREMEWSS